MKTTMELSATASLWFRLATVHGHITSAVEKVLQRRFGFGVSEFHALVALANAPDDGLHIQHLADATSLSQSSMSRLVGRLERDGQVERSLCEHDHRGVHCAITDQGLATLREALPLYENVLRESLSRITTDPTLGSLITEIEQTATSTPVTISPAGDRWRRRPN